MKAKSVLVGSICIVFGSSLNVFAAKGGGGGGPAGNGGSAAERSSPGHGSMNGADMNNPSSARPVAPNLPRDPAPSKPSAIEEHATRSAAPAARDLSDSMKSVNQTAYAQRKDLIESVDLRLQSSRDSLKQIQAEAKASRADEREDFKQALAAVKERESELNSAVKATRNADEAAWEARRGELAKANQNFAEAMARLDAARRAP